MNRDIIWAFKDWLDAQDYFRNDAKRALGATNERQETEAMLVANGAKARVAETIELIASDLRN